MTYRLYIVMLTFVLIACGQKNNSTVLVAGEQKKDSTLFDINTLSSNWREIKEKDGQWFIFNPCDAEPFELILAKNQITVKWGQMSDKYEIIEAKQNTDSSITISTNSGDLKITFDFKLSNGKTLWTIKDSNGTINKKYLIAAKDTVNYKKIDQPCEECWDKEICDSLSKITGR